MYKYQLIIYIIILILTPVILGDTIKSAKSFDVKRYTGAWYEIAKYPNYFQKHCVGSKAKYSTQKNGTLSIINQCLHKNGEVTSVKGIAYPIENKVAQFKVQFIFKFINLSWFQGDYWIIKLDQNYQDAIVSDPQRKYLWILSRTPKMNEERYQKIIIWLISKGFKIDKIVKNKGIKF